MNGIWVGFIAAFVIEVPRILRHAFPDFKWVSPYWILPIIVFVLFLEWRLLRTRAGDPRFDGLGDLLVHIHTPRHPDSAGRWVGRGFVSLLLNLFGIGAGPEGASVEVAHGALLVQRQPSARWFELRRRTGAAMALAAGVCAAFGSPMAAVLLPLELGIGGRVIEIALTSISAFIGLQLFGYLGQQGLAVVGKWHAGRFELAGVLVDTKLDSVSQWLALAAVIFLVALVGAALTRGFHLMHKGFEDLGRTFSKYRWLRKSVWIGGLLIGLMAIFPELQLPTSNFLESVLWGKFSQLEVFFLTISLTLTIALLVSGFGTTGIFWPVYALGGSFATLILSTLMPSVEGLSGIAGLAGGAAFWGAVFGAPLSGALVGYEMTQNVHVLLPGLLAGLLGREIREWLGSQTWVENDLELRGIRLIEGRSARVLESIQVKEAMVTDFETIPEMLPISEVKERIRASRYPFFPVVSATGIYAGFVTVDRIQEVVESSNQRDIQTKDLLYRESKVARAVHVDDSLSATAGLFEEVPCLPVLDTEGRVAGLLFVHSVRLAYDREVAKRSIARGNVT
ncbi:MAG: chloride channel protein [Bdellovibrionales bacterium]|nr:chloride channel protein [Bdellovibrionales bacterium]